MLLTCSEDNSKAAFEPQENIFSNIRKFVKTLLGITVIIYLELYYKQDVSDVYISQALQWRVSCLLGLFHYRFTADSARENSVDSWRSYRQK